VKTGTFDDIQKAMETCKNYHLLIEEQLNKVRQYTKGKVFKITKDLPRHLPDGYNYLRKEKRLCIIDYICFDRGNINATVKVKNKKTRKFEINLRVFLPLEYYGLQEEGFE
jgi:hypothetical protein